MKFHLRTTEWDSKIFKKLFEMSEAILGTLNEIGRYCLQNSLNMHNFNDKTVCSCDTALFI